MAVLTKREKPQLGFPSFSVLRKIAAVLLCVCMSLSLPSCEKKTEAVKADPVFAFNTVFEQKIWGNEEGLFDRTEALLKENEQIFSHTFSGSALYRLNESGEGEMGYKLSSLMHTAVRAYILSGGAFDPALGHLCDLWDFEKKTEPSEEDILNALKASGADKLVIESGSIQLNGVKLNLGGIAKGAAVGEILKAYKDSSVTGGVISCSSAVGVCGKKPDGSLFKIGIRDPDKENEHLALIEITNCLISTSGDYERYFLSESGERYHHILDSKTGYPVKTDLRSVTVVADITDQDNLFTVGAFTDAVSTALFSMGMSEEAFSLLEELSMEAVFVTDTEIFVTEGLQGKLTVTGDRELKRAVG